VDDMQCIHWCSYTDNSGDHDRLAVFSRSFVCSSFIMKNMIFKKICGSVEESFVRVGCSIGVLDAGIFLKTLIKAYNNNNCRSF
jgi:hypothetical protein